MERTLHIQLENGELQARFEWVDFDGDDCFESFRVTVTVNEQSRVFEFGPCANFGLRKLTKFFSNSTENTVGLGFQYPDIRYCDIRRIGDDYRLIVRYEGSGLREEFHIRRPTVRIHTMSDDG